MQKFDVVKVFSATKARDRDGLGDRVTEWINENPRIRIVDTVVKQSSDREFHCLSIVLFGSTNGRKTRRAR